MSVTTTVEGPVIVAHQSCNSSLVFASMSMASPYSGDDHLKDDAGDGGEGRPGGDLAAGTAAEGGGGGPGGGHAGMGAGIGWVTTVSDFVPFDA